MALVQLESIETGFHNSYGQLQSAKKEGSAPCFAKTKIKHLKKSGDTFMFQKGQVFVVAWIEKKRQKTCCDCFNNHQSNMALHLMFLPQDQSRSNNEIREYGRVDVIDRSDVLRMEYHTAIMTRR